MIPIFSTCIKFSMFINLALTFYLQAYSLGFIMESLRISCQLFYTTPDLIHTKDALHKSEGRFLYIAFVECCQNLVYHLDKCGV